MFLRVRSVLLLFINLYLFKTATAFSWRIYGGEELKDDIRTLLVKVEPRWYNRSTGLCSGSVISRSWIITAAHCTLTTYQFILVSDGTEISRRIIGEVYKENIVKHSSYIPKNPRNDIALLNLEQPISFNDKKPVQLGVFRPEVGSAVIIAGYGDTEVNVTPPRQGNVTISQCPNYTSSAIICTQGSVRAGSGDSGGPMIFKGLLVGVITSSCRDAKINKMCVTRYASIAENIGWIKGITKLNNINIQPYDTFHSTD